MYENAPGSHKFRAIAYHIIDLAVRAKYEMLKQIKFIENVHIKPNMLGIQYVPIYLQIINYVMDGGPKPYGWQCM